MSAKVVFLDRDGTINQDKGYVHQIEDFEVIPGALEALKLLTEAKISIYIVTNQGGIAKGLYNLKDFESLTNYMLELFKENQIVVEGVLYCPHHPEGIIPQLSIACECRKPKNTLLKQVIDEKKIPLNNFALIGDKNSDVEAARSLGIKSYLVETGYGKVEKIKTKADFVICDLKSAVIHLLST